jgi:3-hydroxymyristoyl/3-hydroxydecanoyl-(acyl carrier protein) dehydratase
MTTHFVIPTDHPALPGHFPGRPVVPGVLLLDRVAQAARAAFALGPPRGVPRAKFAAPVLPGQAVAVTLDRRGADRVAFTLSVGERVVATGEMAFAP